MALEAAIGKGNKQNSVDSGNKLHNFLKSNQNILEVGRRKSGSRRGSFVGSPARVNESADVRRMKYAIGNKASMDIQ